MRDIVLIMRITSALFFLVVFTSCTYFNFKKEDKDVIVENRLKEIKQNGLELYPEIEPCDTLDGKKCFERQLTSILKEDLEQVITLDAINGNETIWVSIFVSYEGVLSLGKVSGFDNDVITNGIEVTLDSLSPIKPGTINGTPVNCSFKVPLLLKINN